MDETIPSSGGSGLNLSNLLGGLFSAGGLGLSASNQQQAYNGLQKALNTIGPTSLNGYTLSGPGGMSSGYNANGGASIGLGSLNPAFGNLAGVAGSSSGLYNPSLLSNLTNNANGTLGLSTNALTGAYDNYNAGLSAANTQLGNLNQTYGQVYNNTLNSLQAIQQPQVQQQAFGLQNTLFGRGVLDSTGATSGALAAANFGSQVNAMNAQDALSAQQQALSAQTAGANNYATLSNSANGILSNAFNNFGNTNQLISGLNTAQLNNSLSAVQGAGGLNTIGLNNFNSALQTGSAQASARNQSLFPYASVATALAGTQNGGNILGNALSSAGSSLLGGNGSGVAGGLTSLLKGLLGGSSANQQQIGSFLNDLNSSGALNGNSFTNLDLGNDNNILGNYGTYGGNGFISIDDPPALRVGDTDFSSLNGNQLFGNNFDQSLLDQYNSDSGGFSGAGGQAADSLNLGGVTSGTGPYAGEFQSTNNAAVDAYQATNPAADSAVIPSSPGLFGSIGSGLSTVGSIYGIASGLQKGGASGDTQAALGAAGLANKAGAFGGASSTAGGALGAAGGALGIYNGLQQGGVSGYGGAAAGALKAGSGIANLAGEKTLAGTLGNAAGAVAIPLSLYNFAENWQSGNSSSDAINGAEAGATIGGYGYGPIGAVVGGVIGGAVGGISSAFGPGEKDPETAVAQNLINFTSSHGNTPQVAASVPNPYVELAGLFDERSSTLPMYAQYGRKGEQQFSSDMVKQINTAIGNGTISKDTPASQVYSQVVAPWINKMGNGWKDVGATYTATAQGLIQNMVNQYMNGTAASSWQSVGGQYPFSDIYSGSNITPKQNAAMNSYLAMWKTLDTPMTKAQIQDQNAGGLVSRIGGTRTPSKNLIPITTRKSS